jgi:hypothetical protein
LNLINEPFTPEASTNSVRITNDADSQISKVKKSRKVFNLINEPFTPEASTNDADLQTSKLNKSRKILSVINEPFTPEASTNSVRIANDTDSQTSKLNKSRKILSVINEPFTPEANISSVSNLTIANDTISQTPSTVKNSLSFTYSPIRKTRGLHAHLSTVRQQQARRSHTRMAVNVNPKEVKFVCGINRYKDDNYDYMLRVDNGRTDLSTFTKPFKLNILAYDVGNIKGAFDRLVLVGKAKTTSSKE